MNEGGYIIKKADSEKIIRFLSVMWIEIRKETDEFMEKEGPKLWMEYENKIKNGFSKEEAFYSTMNAINWNK